jgi:hypothetical protein
MSEWPVRTVDRAPRSEDSDLDSCIRALDTRDNEWRRLWWWTVDDNAGCFTHWQPMDQPLPPPPEM